MGGSGYHRPMPFDLEELATAAGTSPETIGRLTELGLIPSPDDAGRWPASVLSRVRLALAAEASAIPLDAVGDAARAGSFPLDFVDQLMPSTTPLLEQTHGALAEELALPPGLVDTLRALLGSGGVSPDEPVREDDDRIYRIVHRARELGAGDEQLARVVRAMSDAVRRIVWTERDFVDEVLIRPAAASGASPKEILESTSAVRHGYRHLGRELMTLLHDRFVEDAIFQNLVELGEQAFGSVGALPERPLSPPAIVFVDVTGFTRLTEEQGDDAAAAAASRFAELVHDASAARGGRLVKLLGDGAMLYLADAAEAVRCALEVVEVSPARGLPQLHVGVDAGALVRRDGDYFGSVVNVAARVAGHAGPAEVVVTARVAEACGGVGDLSFAARGPVALRNVGRPVDLFLAQRSSAP